MRRHQASARAAGALRAAGVGVVVAAAVLAEAIETSAAGRTAAAAPASPTITITAPRDGASYERGTRVLARFSCVEPGSAAPATRGIAARRIAARVAAPATRGIAARSIAAPAARGIQPAGVSCHGTVAPAHAVDTRTTGPHSFTVTATDAAGNAVTETVHYRVWAYVNPLRMVAGLQASRIDMGVDYSGSGPILALGRAKVVLATDRLAGPESCWGKTCVPPPGTMIIYQLLDGPFAGKYVYVVENITIGVKAGQMVRAGEKIAILHEGSPNLEIGWALGRGAWTLAAARRHQCACLDPGGWSSIEGRNFNDLLVWLGAPAGYITTIPGDQQMPAGWPRLPPPYPAK